MSERPLLEAEALVAGYGAVPVLHSLSLGARAGRVTALLGANGAGKTTLLRAIAGVMVRARGALRYAGADITALPSHVRVDRGIVLVPEGRMVFPRFTVEENLRIGAYPRAARRDAASGLADAYARFPRLAERRRQLAGTLSGGEQQMLALGRGLMARPRLLLLDEPTLGLAPLVGAAIFAAVATLRADGLTILIAEQNVPRTLALADDAYVIENGRIALAGAARALAEDPRVRESYLGA